MSVYGSIRDQANQYVRRGARRGAWVGGTIGGAAGGALGGLPKEKLDIGTGKKQKRTLGERIGGGLLGAAIGGGYGANLGHTVGSLKGFKDFKSDAYHWANGKGGKRKARWEKTWAGPGSKEWGNRSSRSRYSSPPKNEPMPDWLKGAKTKADAKKAFRDQQRMHHPDRGGDVKKSQRINADWERWQGHFKEAMLRSMFSELEKISSAKGY